MSEKVLGLRKKDIERTIKDWKFEAYARFPSKERRYFLKTVVGIKNLENLFNRKQVPVRLASESVDLKALKEWLKEARDKMPNEYDKAIVSQVTGFILGKTFSEKEAKKK